MNRISNAGLDSLEQGRYALELLLEKRLWLFVVADLFLLFSALLSALGDGGEEYRIFVNVVLLPHLLLAVPAFSTVVALERRAGSLDLALAVPSTERYFVRRAVPVAVLFVLQSWLILLFWVEHWGDLVRCLFQSLGVMCLLVALLFFWAVRLRTSGAVLTASWISVALLSRWIFYDPTISRSGGAPEKLLWHPPATPPVVLECPGAGPGHFHPLPVRPGTSAATGNPAFLNRRTHEPESKPSKPGPWAVVGLSARRL